MPQEEITGYLDTNIGIRRLSEGTNFLENYRFTSLSISTYAVGEFIRTMMLDCCSLLTMIQEEKKLHDVYYRIRDMIDGEDEVNQKIGPRYEILMGLINYPTETRRDWAIKQLGTLIRFILVPMFTDDVNIIESHTK